MLALIRANVATVPIGLLLKIVMGFPYNIFLGQYRKRGYTWKIGGMYQKFGHNVPLSYIKLVYF